MMVAALEELFLVARRRLHESRYFPAGGSNRRIGVATAEREQAVGCACDVEVEREVLVDGEHVAQMPLQRIAGVEALRSVARPQRLHRLARLVHGESGPRAEPQLGLEVRHLVTLGGGLERDGRLAQEV